MDINKLYVMWSWACKQLEVREDASKEEIKKAYREKVKLFHPDASKDINTNNDYIRVQNAYEYLCSNTRPEIKFDSSMSIKRPAKVLGNDAKLNMQLKRQKEIEKSKRKAQAWVPKEHLDLTNNQSIDKEKNQTEEEILNRVRAILLAEHIRREIEFDKAKRVKEAFMQHQILEETEKNGNN